MVVPRPELFAPTDVSGDVTSHQTAPTDVPGALTAEMPAGAYVEVTPEHPGRYVLLRELGRGGQSVVRVARDIHLGRDVAFKQLVTPGVGVERATGRL